MRKFVLVSGLAALICAPVLADGGPVAEEYPELPPDPGYPAAPPAEAASQDDISGFYAGLHAGFGFGKGDGETGFLPNPNSFGAQPFSSSIDLEGLIGGAQAGYNFQFGSLVAGLEADITYAGMDGEGRVSPLRTAGGVPVFNWFQDGSGELEWFGTARARAGFLTGVDALVYATGGLAFGEVEYATFTSFEPLPQFQYAGGASETKLGWTAGGGVEWFLWANWSVKVEYLWFDLGETSYVALPLAPNGDFAVTQSFDTSGNIVRFGANFRF